MGEKKWKTKKHQENELMYFNIFQHMQIMFGSVVSNYMSTMYLPM